MCTGFHYNDTHISQSTFVTYVHNNTVSGIILQFPCKNKYIPIFYYMTDSVTGKK